MRHKALTSSRLTPKNTRAAGLKVLMEPSDRIDLPLDARKQCEI
jgi:hypothetical protein